MRQGHTCAETYGPWIGSETSQQRAQVDGTARELGLSSKLAQRLFSAVKLKTDKQVAKKARCRQDSARSTSGSKIVIDIGGRVSQGVKRSTDPRISPQFHRVSGTLKMVGVDKTQHCG